MTAQPLCLLLLFLPYVVHVVKSESPHCYMALTAAYLTCLSRQLLYFGTLAFPCFDGSYLPKQESEFVHKVLEELDAFQQRDDHTR